MRAFCFKKSVGNFNLYTLQFSCSQRQENFVQGVPGSSKMAQPYPLHGRGMVFSGETITVLQFNLY